MDDKLKRNDIIAAGYSTAEAASAFVQQADLKFKKPDTYTGNRRQYDDGGAKRIAKKSCFDTFERVKDPYTEMELVLTKAEAKSLYGDTWSSHLAEVDHILPLKEGYELTSNMLWVSTEDVRKVLNGKHNLRITSRKWNNAKRAHSNMEMVNNEAYLEKKGIVLTPEGKIRAIRDGEKAVAAIDSKLKAASRENVAETFHESGKGTAQNAMIAALTTSGISNLAEFIKGNKDFQEAVDDVLASGGKAAFSGYVVGGSITVVGHTLSNSSSKAIRRLVKSNIPGCAITSVSVIGKTLWRWENGQLAGDECLAELVDNGAALLVTGPAMALGQAFIPVPIVGAAIGAWIGNSLTSCYYNDFLKLLQVLHRKCDYEIKEQTAVAQEWHLLSKELEKYFQAFFAEAYSFVEETISSLDAACCVGDANEVIRSANQITRKFGGNVCYASTTEFAFYLKNNMYDEL